jgi:periplasmic protein CpxP/Spy
MNGAPARRFATKKFSENGPERDARSIRIMNRMQWKVAMGAALLGLCSFAVYAQTTPPATDAAPTPHNNWRRGDGSERELERLTHALTLTADQQAGVKALLEQQSTQMKALRAQTRTQTQTEAAGTQTTETRQAGMTQMDQIRDETNTKISALLDDTQKKTFADMIARRKAAMARHESREGNPSPPPPGAAGPGGI